MHVSLHSNAAVILFGNEWTRSRMNSGCHAESAERRVVFGKTAHSNFHCDALQIIIHGDGFGKWICHTENRFIAFQEDFAIVFDNTSHCCLFGLSVLRDAIL